MKTFLNAAVVFVGGVLVLAAVGFGLRLAGYYGNEFFLPWGESIRRDVMIESRAYSEATVRELYRLKRQYEATNDPAVRTTIAAAARHEFEIFPEERLPADLQIWMRQIK